MSRLRTVKIAAIGQSCSYDWLFIDMSMQLILAGSDIAFLQAAARQRSEFLQDCASR